MNNTTSASNLTSFANWNFDSTLEGTFSSTSNGASNTSHCNLKRGDIPSNRAKIGQQHLIRDRLASRRTSSVTSRRKTIPTKQSRISTSCASKSRRLNPSTSGLVVAPDRVVCSVYESGKNAETRIGLCTINYSTAELIVSEYLDTQVFIKTLNKIHVNQPTEILIPSHSLVGRVSKLATLIKYNVPGTVKVCETLTKVFNEEDGLEAIKKFSLLPNSSSIPFVEEFVDKSYGLMAVSAASSYIDQLAKNDHSLKFRHFRVKFDNGQNTMLIDVRTIKSLELVDNALQNNGMSLFKYLDLTMTKMGHRSLRNNILQPLTDVDSLRLRTQAIEELQTDNELLDSFRSELKSCHDLDALFSKLLANTQASIPPDQKINFVILLKNSIEITTVLKRYFDECGFNSALLKDIHKILSDEQIENISILINQYINHDTRWASTVLDLQNQKAYAVKSGTNGLLDVLRQLYKSIIDDVMKEVQNLSETYNLSISHGYDSVRRFYLKIRRIDLIPGAELHKTFINRITKKATIEFSTLKLVKLNSRLKEITSEIMILSEQTVNELVSHLCSYLPTLFIISEGITILDILCCFAKLGTERKWITPNFGNKLFLSKASHPILQTHIEDFVPNNVEVLKHVSTFQIITGCNMSGKSIYLKQIALLNVMAQIGCPVPCEDAVFPIYAKLHARVCNDNLEINASTFSSEMRDMAYFTHDVTNNTLMIIDELGRGSSIGDGFSISLAIAEYLLSTRCTVFLSTHFKDIPKILSSKPCVAHLEMKSEIDADNKIHMKYQASNAIDDLEGYGLIICKRFFSSEILNEARRLCELIRAGKKRSIQTIEGKKHEEKREMIKQMKQIHILVQQLKDLLLHKENISLDSLRQIQEKFVSDFQV